MTPSVGRMVHYVSYGTPNGEYKSVCRAAVITEVAASDRYTVRNANNEVVVNTYTDPGTEDVSLCVLNPEGFFFNRDVRRDEDGKPDGTWHEPERVE